MAARYDWLSNYLFESIGEVQNYATDWMWTCNHERPNMALGGITQKQKLALINSTSDHRQQCGNYHAEQYYQVAGANFTKGDVAVFAFASRFADSQNWQKAYKLD